MKKIFITIVFLLTLAVLVNAQQAILDKEPANTAAELNANAIATAQIGETGIINMLSMLQPGGQGDNTKIFNAISGFSFYVTQSGKEDWRAMAVKAYGKALSKITDKENQAFIISQLQIIGKDDAVIFLKKYLNDERLCDPAARALVIINSLTSKTTLLAALKHAQGACRISLVEALGDSRNALAVKNIAALIGTDKKLNKVALYALGNIADPASVNMLADAAQKAGFNYDETNATSAYLLFIKNLALKDVSAASKLATTVITQAGMANQVQTQTAALKLLVDMESAKSMPVLVEAAHNNVRYYDAAIKFAGPFLNPENIILWVKELNTASAAEKAAIIKMLGDNGAVSALPDIIKYLKSSDTDVIVAAIAASGKLGGDKVLDDLLNVLKISNVYEIAAVENALFIMKGAIASKVAGALPTIFPAAQVVLIHVLSARAAHDQIQVVTPLLTSQHAEVRAAAHASLKNLAEEDNLPKLFTLLTSLTQTSEIADVQAAIIAVVGRAKDKPVQSALVLQQMHKAPADKKLLYLNIFAAIGDKRSLQVVVEIVEREDFRGARRQAAITALSQWANVSAAPELFLISKEYHDDQALRGYVGLISGSGYPPDEKIIYLRAAIEIAQTIQQKKLILELAADNKTFPALLFISKYLDDPQLQEDAANDVSNIALSNKNFYGNEVKQWLEKAMRIKKGSDSDYEKVAIRKFIAEMPSDAGLVPLFNNKDITGWKHKVGNPDPIERNKGWYVKDSVLNFSGGSDDICTIKPYRNFEMYVDWKIEKGSDAGIYLRSSHEVVTLDTLWVTASAQVGSGGLNNKRVHDSKPLKLADNPIGDWNNFHIIMKNNKVTVYLNGVLIVDNKLVDNKLIDKYLNENPATFPKESIELQAHGTHVYYRDIYLRELPD